MAWVELRNRVAAATRQVQLDKTEDPVDAVLCAYIALYWYQRPEDVTIYGDFASGYIVTPTLPPGLALRSASRCPQPMTIAPISLKDWPAPKHCSRTLWQSSPRSENGCVEMNQTLNVSPA